MIRRKIRKNATHEMFLISISAPVTAASRAAPSWGTDPAELLSATDELMIMISFSIKTISATPPRNRYAVSIPWIVRGPSESVLKARYHARASSLSL
jgi:hypothetical protein